MRNFKKFLALVLAMLMVSACAVSVAAFNDQAKIDKDFAEYKSAIAMLEDLGVVQGDENKNYNPEKTLTRAEAAVIIAKLVAGAAGQSMDWTAETTKFADVDAKWSFAYINYVADRRIMDGTDIGFEPNRALKIDEALTLALKAADPAELRAVEIQYAQAPTAYWATYYINAAEDLGLTAGLETIYDPEAPCSRAMFAQVAYNMFNYHYTVGTGENAKDVYPIGDGFGFDDITAYVTDVTTAGVVTLDDVKVVTDETTDDIKITADLLNAALKDAGYTETAADLKTLNSKIYLSWFEYKGNVKIASVEVLTSGKVVLYNDADIKIENAYADFKGDGTADELDGTYIVIDDVKYEAGKKDSAGSNGGVLGGTATPVVGIELTVNGREVGVGAVEKLPTYFKAYLYDDNNDGDFERCDIIEYAIAYVTVAKASADDIAAGKVDQYTVTYNGNEEGQVVNKDEKTIAKFSIDLADVPADGDRPVLVQVNVARDCTVDIIEKGEPVTGKVTAISASGKYALIDGNKYEYENDDVVVDTKTRNQTVTAYTINGKLVNISAKNFTPITFIVDNVVVNEAGNVELIGFYADSNANTDAADDLFKADTIVLNGAYDEDTLRYVAQAGHYEANDNDTETKKYGKSVTLGGSKNSDGTWKDDGTVTFAEGQFYSLVKNVDGYYYVATVKMTIDDFFAEELQNDKFSVDAKYINIDGVAQFHNNNTVVITKVADADKNDDEDIFSGKNAYGVTYKFDTSFAEAEDVEVYIQALPTDNKVSFVYITYTGTPKAEIKDSLAEGQSIVQILGKYTEAGYDYFTYEAFDLIAGKKLTVKATVGNLTVGEYYVVKGDEVVDNTATEWMHAKDISALTKGVVTKYSAYPTYFEKSGDEWLFKWGEKTEFGTAQITVYTTKTIEIDEDEYKVIDFKDDKVTAKTVDISTYLKDTKIDDDKPVTMSFEAYIVEDQIIIVK